MSAPLLFLGHAADRTGPPIYLLHFLRWLRSHQPGVDFEIALLAGGELEQDFGDLAPTTVYQGLPPTEWDDVEREFLLDNLDVADRWWAARREHQLRRQMHEHAGARVVYVNGAPAAELARMLPPADRVVLSHVHELEIGLTHRSDPRDRQLLLEGAQRIFVVADAVGRTLTDRYGIDPAVISRHPGTVDVPAIDGARPSADRADERLAKGLPAEGPVVGSCGTVEWRKGVDLFLRLASMLSLEERPEPVTFVWVGGGDEATARASEQARLLGVEDAVRFVGVQAVPLDWFRLMDVFVLPAREDPFPLVCLEALAVGCPVVAFDTGGIPELLDRGCGFTVPYPDVHQLATKVGELLEDGDLRLSMGERGRELVRAEHDVSVLAPRLWAEIEPWLR